MAEGDIIIGEVTDEVRRDSVMALLKKVRWVIAATIVGVIGLVAFFELRSSQAQADGEAQASALALVTANDENAQTALEGLGGSSAFIELSKGKLAQTKGDVKSAISAYKSVAGNGSYLQADRELAELMLLAVDETSDGAILTNPDSPYYVDAMTILAERAFRAGEQETAVGMLNDVINDPRAGAVVPILESAILAWGGEIKVDEVATENVAETAEVPNVE